MLLNNVTRTPFATFTVRDCYKYNISFGLFLMHTIVSGFTQVFSNMTQRNVWSSSKLFSS